MKILDDVCLISREKYEDGGLYIQGNDHVSL